MENTPLPSDLHALKKPSPYRVKQCYLFILESSGILFNSRDRLMETGYFVKDNEIIRRLVYFNYDLNFYFTNTWQPWII